MNSLPNPHIRTILLLILVTALAGCQTVKYRTLEAFGVEKRDILSGRVESASDAQDDAKEQFSSALEQFRATVAFDGRELEDLYDRLDGAYQRSVKDAERVRERIDEVRDVAEDLFDEWADELDEYESADLRRRSRELMQETQSRYKRMIAAKERAKPP